MKARVFLVFEDEDEKYELITSQHMSFDEFCEGKDENGQALWDQYDDWVISQNLHFLHDFDLWGESYRIVVEMEECA